MKQSEETIFNASDVCVVDDALIDRLVSGLAGAPKGRFRLCIHHHLEELVQEMVVACAGNSYNRPHCHPKAASSVAILRGALRFIVFDADGRINRSLILDAESPGPRIVRLAAAVWHMAIPVSELVVIHEVITGPFLPNSSNDWAPWSPEEGDSEAVERYVRRLAESDE